MENKSGLIHLPGSRALAVFTGVRVPDILETHCVDVRCARTRKSKRVRLAGSG